MKRMKMHVLNDVTFEQGCEEYLRDCEARNLRNGTIKHYRDSMKQLFKYVDKDSLIADMDKSTVESLVIQLRNNDELNDMSLYTYTRDFKTLLYFFMEREYLDRFKITIPKADKQPIETYTDSDLMKLLKKPNIKLCSFNEYKTWVIVNFLLSTGVRQNSLLNIKIKEIDFDNGVVMVNVTKNRKPLLIPLNDDILLILKEYLKYRGGEQEDYLFCNVYGQQLKKSTLYHAIYDFNRSRGVELTGLHRFRHTFAKKWVTMGGNVVTLQKILGHSSLAITENYLNILTCDIKQSVNEFNILKEFKKETIKLR